MAVSFLEQCIPYILYVSSHNSIEIFSNNKKCYKKHFKSPILKARTKIYFK